MLLFAIIVSNYYYTNRQTVGVFAVTDRHIFVRVRPRSRARRLQSLWNGRIYSTTLMFIPVQSSSIMRILYLIIYP